MSIEYLKNMFEAIDDRRLVLPDFQRGYVWKKSDQKALAASLLLELPIGSFLILEGKENDFATKELGFATREANPKSECMFLLDGQQRLTSLKIIFCDIFNNKEWKYTLDDVYTQLKVRWFLRIIPNDGEDDIFGWYDLKFNKDRLLNCEPVNVEGRLIDKKIGKTLSKNWWNPDYRPIDKQGKIIENINSPKACNSLAKKMYDENGIIPLYAIGTNEKSNLLKYAIKVIADNRKEELMLQYMENWDKTIELLIDVDPSIEDYKDDDNQINNAWNKLSAEWQTEIMNYLNNILNTAKINSIILPAEKIARAVVIFERINKGGTSLDNFDLLVARAARDKSHESLTKRIISYLGEDITVPNSLNKGILFKKVEKLNAINIGAVKENEIDGIIKKQYLNLISILSYTTYGKVDDIKIDYTKKDKILNLTHDQINNHTEKIIRALSRACIFLTLRCGISKVSELHFNLMILPIAYLLYDDSVWESSKMIDKIEYWYWGSIFTGEYRYNQNDKLILDIKELYKWVKEDILSERIEKFSERILNVPEYVTKEILIRENTDNDIPKAIEKGILQYILSKQPKDILFDTDLSAWKINSGKVESLKLNEKNEEVELVIEDHHIIPLKTATTIQESTKKLRDDKEHVLNSVLNRTYILKKSNRLIGEDPPEKYLKKVTEINGFTSSQGHFINESFKARVKMGGDELEKCWKELLAKRYDAIKTVLAQELHSLYNSTE